MLRHDKRVALTHMMQKLILSAHDSYPCVRWVRFNRETEGSKSSCDFRSAHGANSGFVRGGGIRSSRQYAQDLHPRLSQNKLISAAAILRPNQRMSASPQIVVVIRQLGRNSHVSIQLFSFIPVGKLNVEVLGVAAWVELSKISDFLCEVHRMRLTETEGDVQWTSPRGDRQEVWEPLWLNILW